MNDKETKEFVVGLIKIAGLMASVFKDGVQAADFAVVMAKVESSPELKQALLDAYNGADKIPSEIPAMKLADFIDLGVSVLNELPGLLSAVKA